MASSMFQCGFMVHSITGNHMIVDPDVKLENNNIHHLSFENYQDGRNHYSPAKYLKSIDKINEEKFK